MADAPPGPISAADARRRQRALAWMLGQADFARYVGGAGGVPGDSARDRAVATFRSSFAALVGDTDVRLAAIFRDYVGSTVRSVSPLVVSACRIEGLDLDAVVGSIRHDGAWRAWLGGPLRKGADPWSAALDQHPLDRLREFSTLRRFQRCAAIVREEGEGGGALGFRLGASSVEIGMCTARMALTTSDGTASLTLLQPVPETIRLGIRGRLLDEVVDHPLFDGRGYRISRVVTPPSRCTRLEFRADPLPWTLPWARRCIRHFPDGGVRCGDG